MDYIAVTLCAFAISAFIVATKRWHGKVTVNDSSAVQKFHAAPTPRVGGIAIGLAILFFTLFYSGIYQNIMALVIISSIPMVASGLIEDITGKIGPSIRMLASIITGFIFVIWSGYAVSDIQTPIINNLFQFAPFSIVITALALGGLSNAINLIDGYHGLACGSVAIMFASLAFLGLRVDDYMLVTFSCVHVAAILGFMGMNFPFGRLFLGDGGAYYLGFSLGVNVIMLIERNHEMSPWTVIIVLTYPLIEILYSIYRKWLTPGHSPNRPDRIHFHHLLYRSQVAPRLKKRGLKQYANPMTGLLMWTLPLASAICAQIGFGNVALSILMFFGLIALYLICYAILGMKATHKDSRVK